MGRNETVNAAIASVRRRDGSVGREHFARGDATVAESGHAADSVAGSCASAGEYPEAIALMASGAIRVKPLISAIAPLTEGPRGLAIYAREPNLLKVVLTPGAGS